MTKPTLEQVVAYAQSDLDGPKLPTPHEIALAFGCALLSSGRFADDAGAAVTIAWTLVIPYYQGELTMKADIDGRRLAAGMVVMTDPEMSTAEARAYVAGESGNMGEYDLGDPAGDVQLRAMPPELMAQHAAAAEKADHINRCAERVREADAALTLAKAGGKPAKIKKAQAAYDQAVKEQSEAYL
jgi:hypothetical protein